MSIHNAIGRATNDILTEAGIEVTLAEFVELASRIRVTVDTFIEELENDGEGTPQRSLELPAP